MPARADHRRLWRRVAVALVTVVVGLVAAAPLTAAPRPREAPVTSEYVETVPTTKGSRPSRGAGSRPAPRRGAGPPPGEVPAISEYVEMIPTSEGPRPTRAPGQPSSGSTGQSSSGSTGARLDPEVRERLEREGGEDAALLEEVATSPALGAPERRVSNPRAQGAQDAGDRSAASAPAAASAVAGNGRLLGFAVALVLVSSALAVVALVQARRRSAARTRSSDGR